MNYALCQINTTIGDFDGNTRLICEEIAWARGQGVDLVIFPELAITGYPPSDLLESPEFIERNLAALDTIRAATHGIGVVVGYVSRCTSTTGRTLWNSAAFLADGQLVASQAKTLLPTYDVFDEGRYFAPADEYHLIPFRGHQLGLSICEDYWASHEPEQGHRLYAINPLQRLCIAGADLIINISASPFAMGKGALRRHLLSTAARDLHTPILFVNMVGGNGQLVFDGESMAYAADGRLVWIAPSGCVHHEIINDDIFAGAAVAAHEPTPIAAAYDILQLGLRDYLQKCGFDEVLLGLSGGIDSAVVACIAVAALGADRVRAVTMPSPFTASESVRDALLLAQRLGIRCDTIPITDAYIALRTLVGSGHALDAPDLAEENLQARLRGAILMTLSNRSGAIVLSTGNKSELAVGYCTLYGDMTGGLALISDLLKTEVYMMAEWINRNEELIPTHIITRPASAELRPQQTDQDTLPPYALLDQILTNYIEEQQGVENMVARGWPRGVVEDVVRRVNRNEYKRQQAPPGIKLTDKAFGMGRRIPIVAKY